MQFNLNEDDKKVFKWIAEEQRKGRAIIDFTEAMNELGISDPQKFNGLLEKLRDHPDIIVVEEIRYGGMVDTYFFKPSSHAYTNWILYQLAEKETICPKCGERSLQKKTVTVLYCTRPDCSYERPEIP